MTTLKPKQSLVAEHNFFYGHAVVAASFAIMVVIWAAYYSFGVFFKPMVNEFGWTSAATSAAFSLSAIISGLVAITMGKLTDKFGPRFVMRICAALLAIGFLLMSKVAMIWQLYLVYGLIIGIGMGGSFVPLMSTVVKWFSKRRSMMAGIVAAGVSIGALIGPPTVHRLIITYGWRISYVILGTTVFIIVIIVTQFIRKDPIELGQLADGVDKIGEQPGANPSSRGLSFREAIFSGQFWVVFFMFFCLGFCTFAIIVHVAPHAIELRIPAVVAAAILATIGGLGMIGRVVMGRAADIFGSKRAFMIGFILMSAALLGLMPVKMVWLVFVLAGLFGFANGTCVASQSPLVALLFGLSSHGVILGFLSFGFTSGGAFGPWLSGIIFDIAGSYRLAFLMCAAVSLIGLFLTSFLKTKRVEQDY
jgi:MFS family permease